MRVLLLDNYDSFTYNLFHLLEQFVEEVEVHRNDAISLQDVDAFDKIILSPGPGLPAEAGIMPAVIANYSDTKSILGVCLGMQGIATHFGARLNNLDVPLHGCSLACSIEDSNELLFEGIPEKFTAGRYHSWVVDPASLPEDLKVTSKDSNGNITSIAHRNLDVKGVQFHPESVMTAHGKKMIENWLKA